CVLHIYLLLFHFLLFISYMCYRLIFLNFPYFFFQAEDGIRDRNVTGVQTCALPIYAVVIGRSNIVGKPVGQLLLNENATVTYTHSKTVDIKAITNEADIVIAAVGKQHFVDASFIKEGAAVIDVGIHRT